MPPTAALHVRDVNRATLARQGLLDPITASSAAGAVRALGSLQAQHPEWPPIALAGRVADPAIADLAGALTTRRVVRSSLMRITIHVVAAEDLWPMFTVVQPLRLNQWKLIHKADPVESALGRRMLAAHPAAIAALRERPRSSLELDRIMAAEIGPAAPTVSRPGWRNPDARIVVRSAWRHFAAFVPLVHVPHDGEGYGRSRYALGTEWLDADPGPLDPAAARVHVARRYLAAFGPATVEDLASYVGRGKGGIGVWRSAVAALAEEVVELHDSSGRTLLDLADAPRPSGDTPAPPRLLARWDSLLLSHEPKHRERIIAEAHRPAVFRPNADVLPTFLVDGFVAGTWDLRSEGDGATVELRPFSLPAPGVRDALVAEADRVLSLVTEGERRVKVAG